MYRPMRYGSKQYPVCLQVMLTVEISNATLLMELARSLSELTSLPMKHHLQNQHAHLQNQHAHL